MKTLRFLLLLSLSVPVFAAEPKITDNGPVGKYGTLELTFDLGKVKGNPFDPTENKIEVFFFSPKHSTYKAEGFIYQDYQRTGDFDHQTLTPVGGLVWKVRFTPQEVGNWEYRVDTIIIDGKKIISGVPETHSFKVVPSKSPGFVGISNSDPHYFAFDNGQPYFPLGENMAWPKGNNLYQYDKWLEGLSSVGGNYIRLWQAPWFTEIEWDYSYPSDTKLPGNYMNRLKEAWELDYVLDLCRQKGVYALLCLINHGKFSSETNPDWGKNPYNKHVNPTGGFMDKPEEVWTNDKTKMYLKRNWRYLIARYASYTSLQSWEIFNEMEWTDHYADLIKQSAAFHKEMGDYLKASDPYKHLVTTSYASALKWPNDVWDSGMNFTQEHNYGGLDMAQVADTLTTAMMAKCPGKPFFLGEMGLGAEGGEHAVDPTGIFIHNTNWGSLTAGAAGGGFIWWWDNYVEPDNLYWRWKGIAGFVAGEDMDKRGYMSKEFAVTSSLRAPLAFSPGNNSWGVKAAESQYTIGADGSVTPMTSNLTSFLYSSSKEQFRSPPTFHVNLKKPTKFRVALNGISKGPGNKVSILVDGEKTSVDGAEAQEHSVFEVQVPAGAHDITVDSTGSDWVQVGSYSLTDYASALRCKAIVGKGKVLGRVQSRYFTYASKENPEVKDGVLHLSGLGQDGPWKVEWWDTDKGVKTGLASVEVKSGAANLALPSISRDLAFKLIAN